VQVKVFYFDLKKFINGRGKRHRNNLLERLIAIKRTCPYFNLPDSKMPVVGIRMVLKSSNCDNISDFGKL
jgi:hypothetical protein